MSLIISNKNINELELPTSVNFTLDDYEWLYGAESANDKRKYLFQQICIDRLIKEIYNDRDEEDEEYYSESEKEVYSRLDDVPSYLDKLKECLDRYNIKYIIQDDISEFEECFSEFFQCAFDTFEDGDITDPTILYRIMKDDKSILNFLFCNDSKKD